MPKVYISSSVKDLSECREEVAHALRRMEYDVVHCESYTASGERPVDRCVSDAKSCDIYVGIFAFRHGFVPEGHEESITELEWRAAVEAKKDCFIFLLEEDARWPIALVDPDRGAICRLRERLQERHMCDFFSDAAELVTKVQSSLIARVKSGQELVEEHEATQGDIRFFHDTVYRINTRSADQVRFWERLAFTVAPIGLLMVVLGLVIGHGNYTLVSSAGLIVAATSLFPIVTSQAKRKEMSLLEAYEQALKDNPPPAYVVEHVRKYLALQLEEVMA